MNIKTLQKMMAEKDGHLNLYGAQITSLPDNFTVEKSLNLERTQITELPENLTVGDSLSLEGLQITTLPKNLTVGGDLYLTGTLIRSLPEGFTVGGSLHLYGTRITELPENLTVGKDLRLSGLPITLLPKNLTVGRYLDLERTLITNLPEGLTVGGSLQLEGSKITVLPDDLQVGCLVYFNKGTNINNMSYRPLQDGDYCEGRYLYADRILTHVKKKISLGEYTIYVGKIKGHNVVSDGTYYAHCNKFRDGISDLVFKRASERGMEQYKGLSLDSSMSFEEAKTMYRVITGACRQGTEHFVKHLPEIKNEYTIREIIDMTRGHYGSDQFKTFFS